MRLPPSSQPAVEHFQFSLCYLCSIVTSSSTLPLLPPSCEDPCDYTGRTWRSQDNLLISRYLITFARSCLSCEVTYSQVPGIKRTSLGGHYSAYHTEGSDGVQSHAGLNILPRNSHTSLFIGQLVTFQSHGHT